MGEERTGDAFVPHNELFQHYSLSDDCKLAQAEVGRREQPRLEKEPISRGAGEQRGRPRRGGRGTVISAEERARTAKKEKGPQQ